MADEQANEQASHLVEFVDTPEEVDRVFHAQRKLSLIYGGVFFVVTLAIPVLSITAEWWYDKPIWGGFTLNYLVVALLYHVFYFGLGWAYAVQANALEERILGEEARMAAKGVTSA